jgi:dihydrofolate reductase
MSKLIFDMSVSLDGYTNGADPSLDQPMGADGMRLHEWAFGGNEADRAVLDKAWPDRGAMICGRKTYDLSIPEWGADGPSGDKRLPLVVITHSEPDDVPANSAYSFATGEIEAALEEARDRADGGDIAIMGGPSVGGQYLRAGLVDEVALHVVPVLLGAGTRLFDDPGGAISMETIEVIRTDTATHLRLRVLRG